MRWIRSEDFFREIRLPAVVDTVFGYFLASYVPPETVTIAEFYERNEFCYDENFADEYMENGWYLHCVHRHFRTWPLDCEVLRWAPVRDNDPALQWVVAKSRKPPALETVLVKTPAGKFCAIYVPPLTVAVDDFLHFDPQIEFKPHLWEKNEAQNGLKNNKYTLAMARTQAPHSASSQFFINTKENDFLNHTSPSLHGWGYAVFGKVVEGQDVVDAIEGVATKRHGYHDDVPTEPVVITKAEAV